jgi:aspartate kinase
MTLTSGRGPPRHRRAIFGPWPGGRERRHDRPEHLGGGAYRHDLLLPHRSGEARRQGDGRGAGAGELAFGDLVADTDVAKVSIVGIGMRSHAGVAAQMFKALADEGINIKVITTSEIKISVLIDRKYMELAVQALHDAFALDAA